MRPPNVTISSRETSRSRRGIAPVASAVCAIDGILATKRKKRGITTSVALVRHFTSDHRVARACGEVDLVAPNVTPSAERYDRWQQLLAKALARRGKSDDEDDYRRKSA